jgi:hypothetical protein
MHSSKTKTIIRILIVLYALTLFFHDLIRYGGVFAEQTTPSTNIVVVLVDEEIHANLKPQIQRYASSYIQGKIPYSKALVFPINTSTFQASDISKMLENIYHDGIDGETSQLIGLVLVWNVPLPVVEHDNYIFPSIYPYVDFEDHQYIRDYDRQFFTYNDNSNGQAELRHGIINLDTDIEAYRSYFAKLQRYANDPSNFVSNKIRYDDLIALPQYIQQNNLINYANKFIFAEDIAYHRYNNLLFNTLQASYNQGLTSLSDDLRSTIPTDENNSDPLQQSLDNYANQMQQLFESGAWLAANTQTSNIPTLLLSQSLSAFFKSYDEIISPSYKEIMRENTQAWGRRYIAPGANDVDSHLKMISMRDDILFADYSDLQPILVQFNTLLEQTLNQKFDSEWYALHIPLPLSYRKEEKKFVPGSACQSHRDEYEAYAFGRKAASIDTANELTIFQGTFQNLTNLSGEQVQSGYNNYSVGKSYNIFSQQTEANRAYNILNMQSELDNREQNKIYVNYQEKCSGIRIAGICLLGNISRDRQRSDRCEPYQDEGRDTKETALDFAIRIRWGYSPLNLEIDPNNPANQKLKLPSIYPRYLHAIQSIYDPAGSKKISTGQENSNASEIIENQVTLTQTRNHAGDFLFSRCIDNRDQAQNINGVPFVSKRLLNTNVMNYFDIFTKTSIRNVTPDLIILERQPGNTCSLTKNDWLKESRTYKTIDSTIYHTSPTPEQISNMNITTNDRPIDSIRYMSFQGIDGNQIRLNYPNIYEIPVYTQTGEVFYLQSIDEIEQNIVSYLQETIKQYNNQLQTAYNNKNTYYNSNQAAFDLLAQANNKATPNRTYQLLDLNILVNTLGSGNIRAIAEILYYHNSARPSKRNESNITDHIYQHQSQIDINHKITDTLQQYLTIHNPSSISVPGYNSSWYEAVFLNTNGQDYIASNNIPAFITRLQASQEQYREQQNNTINFQATNNELSAFEEEDQNKCNYDVYSAVPLDKRPAALACWLQQTLEKPLTVSVTFPWVKSSIESILDPITTFQQNQSNFNQQRTTILNYERQNTQILNTIPANQASTLQDILQYTITENNESSRYADPDIDQAKYISVSSLRDYGNIRIQITATGDNCLHSNLLANNTSFCDQGLSYTLNPYKNPISIPIILDNNIQEWSSTAGDTTIIFKLCILENNQEVACVHKTQAIYILPWEVDNIDIISPDIIIQNGQIPLVIKAEDKFGNAISKTIDNYVINASTGTISKGGTFIPSMIFNDFDDAQFIYQAPNLTHRSNINLIVNNDSNNTNNIGVKQITVVEPNVEIYYNNTSITNWNFTYKLPNTKTNIIFEDTNGIQQVNQNSLPKIDINLQDIDGNPLSSRVQVSSSEGLTDIGEIISRQVNSGNISYTQTQFRANSTFYINTGQLTIYLYPNFKAGTERISIRIPWRPAQTFSLSVQPGDARKIKLLAHETTVMQPNSTQQVDIQIFDNRDNPIQSAVNIQIGSLGSVTSDQKNVSINHNASFQIQSNNIGGQGYIYAYIQDIPLSEQLTDYQSFLVQDSMIPTSWFNSMHLTLLGKDRWADTNFTQELIKTSPKLLSITTQLTDTNNLQKIGTIITQDGQIKQFDTLRPNLRIRNNQLRIEQNGASVIIGTANDFTIQTVSNISDVQELELSTNTIIYIPQTSDTYIQTNNVENQSILINNQEVWDINTMTNSPEMRFELQQNQMGPYTSRSVIYQDRNIGSIMIRRNDTDIISSVNINEQQRITYANGSTNGIRGIGLTHTTQNAFNKSYNSIEDSEDETLFIGFRWSSKHLSNFAAGQSIGEATRPFWSPFLINIGDPLISKTNNNRTIQQIDHEGGLGQNIYTQPGKTIFKSIPVDINNDNLDDIIVVYTDGSLQIVKNYGNQQALSRLGNLMVIADSIKDIFIADTDNNGYSDIIVRTNQNQMRVYRNEKGIFDVDGQLICLDIPGTPGSLAQAHQVFVQDMDQDNNVDIITNDTDGNIKIFYGGSDTDGAYYISNLPYTCDSNRRNRQENQSTLVKSFGIELDSSKKIIDTSLVHRQGLQMPDLTQTNIEISDWLKNLAGSESDAAIDTIVDTYEQNQDTEQLINNMNQILQSQGPTAGIQSIDMDDLIQAGYQDIVKYISTPFKSFNPSYESTLTGDNIAYIPIQYLNTQDQVQVYKQYTDLNGGILRDNDKVRVIISIYSKTDTKITFIDQIRGPRRIAKNTNGSIESFSGGNLPINTNIIRRPENTDYDYIIDNIEINQGEIVQFSYILSYEGSTPMTIDIVNKASSPDIQADIYPDISIQPQDACSKYMRVYYNTANSPYRNYTEQFVDLRSEIQSYQQELSLNQNNNNNDIVNDLQNKDNTNNINDIPGINSLVEKRNTKNIVKNAINNGGLNINANIDLGILDGAVSQISDKIDQTLNNLCNGFALGGNNPCLQPPVPFNMSFLTPGTFNIFGCTLFKDKGLPAFFAPSTLITPVWPVPFVWFFWAPLKWPTDTFFWAPGGTYPSMIRIYVSPTLTAQLGVSICLGPMSTAQLIPQPFRDLGGNCIVLTVPMPGCEDKGSTQVNNETIITPTLDPRRADASRPGICNNPVVTSSIQFGPNTNSEIAYSSPFQLVSRGENSQSYTPGLPVNSIGFGTIVIDQKPISFQEAQGQNQTLDGIELKAWPSIDLKIQGWDSKGIAACIVQNWLDSQVRYIMANLTQMTIDITLPNMEQIFGGFGDLSAPAVKKAIQEWESQASNQSTQTTITGLDRLNKRVQNNMIQKQTLSDISTQVSNPFETLSNMFNSINLVNINTKDIIIDIPLIYTEDIIAYSSYLQSWIEQNEQILIDWTDTIKGVIGYCNVTPQASQSLKQTIEEFRQNTSNRTRRDEILNQLNTNNNLTSERRWQLEQELSELDYCINLSQNTKLQDAINFQDQSAQTIRAVKQNIIVLEQYQQFPLELYEWLHVSDRYLSDVSALVNDFLGSISYWLNTNAKRFSQYVDAMISLIGVIQTRQVLIDFSVNRSKSCSTCTNDTYDYYSCSLAFLCPELPILPIPPFKLPSIFIDMSKIDLGIDILLPVFKFNPSRIPLAQIPNLPSPPNISASIDIDLNRPILTTPQIPILPQPPQLPDLPWFVPQVDIDLPVLPPAPKIPAISTQVQSTIKASEFIGKIMCIVKGQGVWLVAEDGVKSKIEQMTQRTRNVPFFDYLNQTSKYQQPPLQGFDYQIDSFVQIQFNFEPVYTFINSIAQQVNKVVDNTVQPIINNPINEFNETVNQQSIQNAIQGIENPGSLINYNLSGTHTLVSYEQAQKDLEKSIDLLISYGAKPELYPELQNAKHAAKTKTTITPLNENIDYIQEQIQQDIYNHKQQTQKLIQQIKDYDTFINNLEKNSISLVSNTSQNKQYSIPILSTDKQTLQILQQQEAPQTSSLKQYQTIIEGYKKAVTNNVPETLRMTPQTHKQVNEYIDKTHTLLDTTISQLNQQEQKIKVENKRKTPDVIISQELPNSSRCINCNTPGSSTTDLSQYVQGIFMPWSSGQDIRVVNSLYNSALIGDNYLIHDFNKDQKKDLILRDSNSVYIKYADQNTEYNYNKNHYTSYYLARNLSSPESLQRFADARGYIRIRDLQVKVYDSFRGIKNFRMQGQSFDTLTMTRSNSSKAGDQIQGYIMQLNNRFDTFHDKEQIFNLLSNQEIDKTYVLIIPASQQNTISNQEIILPEYNRPVRIQTLIDRGIVSQIVPYDPTNATHTSILTNLSRNRKYTQIAALGTGINNARIRRSPRSNQIVAGTQILADTQGPQGIFSLYRPSTTTVVATGEQLEGYIATRYNIQANWKDNLQVASSRIEQNGKIIAINDTGSIQLSGLFFTGDTTQNYIFAASDFNNNITRKTITLQIKSPDIDISHANQTATNTSSITAILSHDIDEGFINFQKERNNLYTILTGINSWESISNFPVEPGQTIITGGIFDIGNTIGLYDNRNNRIATINPDNGHLNIDSEYATNIYNTLNFSSHVPVIELRTNINNTPELLFNLYFKPQSLFTENPSNTSIIITNPRYQKLSLDQNFGSFENGTCIQDTTNSQCIMYISPDWFIYVPSPYNTSLKGQYTAIANETHIKYTIKDQNYQIIGSIYMILEPLAP